MIKKLLLVLLCSIFVIASEQIILEPEDALMPSFEKKEEALVFKLKLGKDIYAYDDKLKVLITKPEKVDITQELDIPEPVPYEEWQVHFKDLNINIPFSLIKSKIEASNIEITVEFQGCSKAGLCYVPMSETISVNFDSSKNSVSNVQKTEAKSETDIIAEALKDKNILITLATFFGFGLLLSLTPCILPMIPILSSIIVKAGDNETLTTSRGFFLSLVYVLAMSFAYTIAGVLAGLFGANLQVALQNPYVLTIFATIFIVLALSMFGYFKLELPQSLQNKIDKTTKEKQKQGIMGIAIMGFLSALIVGPCVAPPLAGALVYIGQTGDAVLGAMALFVLSFGMGVPLLLIGLGAGKYMPKPGTWMQNVSKIFGIVMLAVAIWMLDRVLNATIIMYLWALLLIGSSIYLKVFEHLLAKLITIVILIYGVLLFIGAVSGETNPLQPLNKFTSYKTVSEVSNSLNWKRVKTLEELNSAIKASNKPIILDFYADWCVSCKELENITFKDPMVIQKLKQFTLLKADVTDNTADDKALQARFKVVGPPAIIFWDENKKEIKASQIVGYKSPKEFLDIVNKYFK